jgi:hypothetical protein
VEGMDDIFRMLTGDDVGKTMLAVFLRGTALMKRLIIPT